MQSCVKRQKADYEELVAQSGNMRKVLAKLDDRNLIATEMAHRVQVREDSRRQSTY